MDSLNRACKGCGVVKESNQFYQKNGTQDGIRLDTLCKECRKLSKKNSYKQDKKPSSWPIIVPQETLVVIEPSSSRVNVPIPSAENDKKTPEKSTDYSIWERAYGRVLTESERFEVKQNLVDLFSLLTEIEMGGKAI